jgi:hypothetical protein
VNCAAPFDVRQCAGYAEAVARENGIRGAACLGVNEVICGIEVKLLCPAHLGLLSIVNYPFHGGYTVEELCGTAANKFTDGKPDLLTDIMRFLWIVSPQYKTGARTRKHRWQRKTARDKFNEAFAPILKEPVPKVVAEILAYVEEAFIDCDDSTPAAPKLFNATQISIAAELHEHYGYRIDFWSPDCPPDKNPLLVPLKIIAQLRKYRANHAGNPVFNKSDKLVQAALDKMSVNAEKK